jgi:hypothetical protein
MSNRIFERQFSLRLWSYAEGTLGSLMPIASC